MAELGNAHHTSDPCPIGPLASHNLEGMTFFYSHSYLLQYTLSYLKKKSNAHETALLLFNTSNAERHHLTAVLSLVRCADLVL